MGSCVYIGYRAKKKADEIRQAYKSNDLNKLAGALGAGSSKDGSQGPPGAVPRIPRHFPSPRGRPPPGLNPEAKCRCVPGSQW